MLGLGRSLPVFQQPPCICDEIEGRVREAIAMRDEMAKWDTPLEAWIKLQQMPVLRLKSEPEAKRDDWSRDYDKYIHSPVVVQPRTVTPYSGVIYDGSPSSLSLQPGEQNAKVGDILNRGNGRYQITERDTLDRRRVRVLKLRD